MIFNEIRCSQIIQRLRFDAEHYQPESLLIERRLNEAKSAPLGEIAKFSELRRNPKDRPGNEFLYIDISNINIFTGDIDAQLLKGYEAPSRARKVVKENDLILSTVRPNRNAVAIIPKELDSQICSTGFSVIRAEKINPWFLFAFLKTKYAIKQLVRMTMASMYPSISEEDISSILIPVPENSFQQKIESIVRESYKRRKEADGRYKEAKALLNKALGIEELELKDEKVFETRFGEVESGNRMDSDFYKPIFRISINTIKDGEKKGLFLVKKLGEIAKISRGVEVGSGAYADDGKLFLRVSNITEKEITISDSAEFIKENLFNTLKVKYQPMPGEILYTKDATIGIAFPIDDDFKGAIISGGIIRIKPHNDLDQYYSTLVLNSVLCRSQAERHSIGAVIKHYPYSKIRDLIVPIVHKEKQNQISELVKQSFSLRKEAKELLEKAKKEVEEFVEKNNGHNHH